MKAKNHKVKILRNLLIRPCYAFKMLNKKLSGTYSFGNDPEVFGSAIYNEWRKKRIKILLSLFGKKWFKNKKLIEFGAGRGDISAYFYSLGADVTACEIEEENIKNIKKTYPFLKVLKIDNDRASNYPFKYNEFDLVIHWALLYHLKNWALDLKRSIRIGRYLSLESEVVPCKKPIVIHQNEAGADQAFHGVGSYCSSQTIERTIKKIGAKYKRYDSKKLNCFKYKYDWFPQKESRKKEGFRRFWLISKKNIK